MGKRHLLTSYNTNTGINPVTASQFCINILMNSIQDTDTKGKKQQFYIQSKIQLACIVPKKQQKRRQQSNRLFIFTRGPIQTLDLQQESCRKKIVTTSLKTISSAQGSGVQIAQNNLNSGLSDFCLCHDGIPVMAGFSYNASSIK